MPHALAAATRATSATRNCIGVREKILFRPLFASAQRTMLRFVLAAMLAAMAVKACVVTDLSVASVQGSIFSCAGSFAADVSPDKSLPADLNHTAHCRTYHASTLALGKRGSLYN